MKTKFLLSIVFLSTVLCSFSVKGNSDFVEDKEISTKDGSCSIKYLTNKNVKGWHISADEITCSDEGFLHGYHYLTINNAFSQPVEELYGYFSNGYWTGPTFVNLPVLTRSTEKNGTQKATFFMDRDHKYQLDYIGQMMSKQDALGAYSSFQVCNPFRLLIVTKNIPYFADKGKQRLIFKEIEKKVRTVCPSEEKVLLFLSPVIEPRQEDIVFYAEIDLKNDTKKTKWLEESLKNSGYYEQTVEAAILTDNTSNNVKDLDVLRKSLAKKIDLLPFKTKKENKSVSFQPEKTKVLSEEPPPAKQTSFLNNEEKAEEEITFDNNEDAFENPQFLIPKPKKNYQHEQTEIISESSDPIMHLVILSKIKQEPVPIQTIVHIHNNTYNESYVNSPLPLKIKDNALKPGWYQVTGTIEAEKNDDTYFGIIHPTNIQNYKSE